MVGEVEARHGDRAGSARDERISQIENFGERCGNAWMLIDVVEVVVLYESFREVGLMM